MATGFSPAALGSGLTISDILDDSGETQSQIVGLLLGNKGGHRMACPVVRPTNNEPAPLDDVRPGDSVSQVSPKAPSLAVLHAHYQYLHAEQLAAEAGQQNQSSKEQEMQQLHVDTARARFALTKAEHEMSLEEEYR